MLLRLGTLADMPVRTPHIVQYQRCTGEAVQRKLLGRKHLLLRRGRTLEEEEVRLEKRLRFRGEVLVDRVRVIMVEVLFRP